MLAQMSAFTRSISRFCNGPPYEQRLRNHLSLAAKHANDFENRPEQSPRRKKRERSMSGEAVLENARRYRAIASLCRQTAAFRPEQKWSLLQQAEDWERRAISEIEDCLQASEPAEEDEDPQPSNEPQIDTRWWLPRREGLFANL